jgi:hemoglobin-like flavoprotein
MCSQYVAPLLNQSLLLSRKSMSLNIELLEQSFKAVKVHNAEFSVDFYNTLFTEYPDVKPLFANTNMKEQGDHLYKSLVLVVLNLRNPEFLTNTLKGLGTRHVRYGILPHHYPIVGSVAQNF